MAKKRTTPKKVSPIANDQTAWRVILIKHVRQGSDLEFIVEDFCDLDERCKGGSNSGEYFEERVFPQWISGEYPKPAHSWAVCIRLAREKWMFFEGPQVTDELIRKIGKKKEATNDSCWPYSRKVEDLFSILP